MPVKAIKGLVSRSGKHIIAGQCRTLEMDKSKYLWPGRGDFPMDKYHDCPGGVPVPSAQMLGSRGCPYLCTFCVWPQLVYGGRK